MPHSTRNTAAKLRARYTGETMTQARAGVARGRNGLDHCTPAQRALRALLAVAVFNRHPRGTPPADWHAHRLIFYTFYLSPRYDDLVIFTRQPEQVANCFLMQTAPETVFPGWRAACVNDHHIRLRHVPTGAFMGVERAGDRNRVVCARPCPNSEHDQYQTHGRPLTDIESMQVGAIPPMSVDTQILLSGLFARFTLTAPDLSWATGGWHLRPRGVGCGEHPIPEPSQRLWGAHDRWELRWGGFPDAAYVATALTGSEIGLAGATCVDQGHEITVSYGTAALVLQESSRIGPGLGRRWF